MYGIFLHKFPKITIHNQIQQFNLERNQKYLQRRFYTIKKPMKNRARDEKAFWEAEK